MRRVIKQVTQQVQTTPFSFLQKAESENLLTFIQDEHPQTIALILAHLPPQKASEILVGLPSQKQIEVVKRIANMEQTNPEVIKEVERGLEHRLVRYREPNVRESRRRGHRGGDSQSGRPFDGKGDHGRARSRGSRSGRADSPAHVRLRGHSAGQRQGDSIGAQGSRQRRAVAGPQDGQRGIEAEDFQEHVRACGPAYRKRTCSTWARCA
jgi:hypothetical protein